MPEGRVVGVVPAAGSATRLQPLPCSKEMLQVGGRPVLEYALDRILAAAPAEVRVVTRPEKEDVRKHAARLGARVLLGEPPTFAASVLAGLDGLDDGDVILLALPDSLWEPRDGFRLLLERLGDDTDVVLGVFPSSEPERSDVVVLAGGRVAEVAVKPSRPATGLVWGCAAARASALRRLDEWPEPGQLFDALARAGRVAAVCFPGEFVDIGTKESLRRTLALLPGR